MYVSWAHNRAVRQPTSRIRFSSGTPASNLAVRTKGKPVVVAVRASTVRGSPRGFDFELKVTIAAPPQRAKLAVQSAIQDELIVVADELLALDFVAIPLLARRRLEQRLRI